MNADDAWIWLMAILAVWCVLGAALFDLLHHTDTDADTEGEPVSRYPEPDSPDTRYGTTVSVTAKRVSNRQVPALPWRRCIRSPKARRRIRHANRLRR
jgi:hypothetical protein